MRFVALDGWRGLSALTVALFHLHANSHLYTFGIIRNSYLFVDFFFVLSGFVVTSAYLDRLGTARGGTTFLLRRFGRLYPLHLAVTSLFVLIEFGKFLAASRGLAPQTPAFSGETSFGALIYNLLLVHSLGLTNGTTWNFPSWSISVEFYTYVLFALAVTVSARIGAGGRVVLFAGLALAGALITVGWSTNGMDVTYDLGFFRCVYGFFFGAIAEWLYAGSISPRFARMSRASTTILELAAVSLTIVFVSNAERYAVSFLAPVVFLPVVLIFAGQRGLLSAVLSSRPMRAIGDWSYSIYMIHAFIVVDVVGRLVALARRVLPFDFGPVPDPTGDLIFDFGSPFWGDGLVLAYAALVLAVASLSYRYVEWPARRFFNRLADRLDGRRRARAGLPGAP
ncbi:MAG: acyltransferase [Ancalomicrobiaceae bacterium]|nr:acyltransferase [Ancalomicrobiaceae bacterium]